jgi:hypothetical protein
MKFLLVFDNSGDTLPFEVKYNHKLFEFFVEQTNKNNQNLFSDDQELYKSLDKKITHLHWAISKTNEVLYDLVGKSFKQHTDLINYLDQKFLNILHSDWVFSHQHSVDIDKLRFSSNLDQARIGNQLHDMYSDDIRFPYLAPVLEKVGYIYPYREINMGVHRLEHNFSKLEFKADNKWDVIDNPLLDTLVTNNDIVNFSFNYTYVGRQYYNKFKFFDTNLECPDHYNYETLEFAFQINLSMPETIPFSKESIQWANSQNIKLVAEQIPIANIVDLENNLFEYRKVLYRNSRDNNRARIIL